MTTMEFKGITWVGDMYERFEAMCLEVEEVMYQDTVQYVESQVKTVSSSVKKFYSEVMEDFLPPSMDTVKPDTDVGIYKKPKPKNNEDTIKVHKKATEDVELNACVDKNDKSPINRLRDIDHFLPQSPINEEFYDRSDVGIERNCEITENHEVTGYDSVEEEKIGNSVVGTISTSADASTDSPINETIQIEPSGKKGSKLKFCSSSDGPGGLSAESCDTDSNCGVVSPIGSYVTGDIRFTESAERSGHMDVIETNNIVEPEIETNEHFDKLKLEETCVLVDGNKLFLVSPRESKRRSYKKKIREAFTSKMKLTRKEYEQLAVEYEDIDEGSNRVIFELARPTLTKDPHEKNLPTHDFCESEWELL